MPNGLFGSAVVFAKFGSSNASHTPHINELLYVTSDRQNKKTRARKREKGGEKRGKEKERKRARESKRA